jgi:hypothetical protein
MDTDISYTYNTIYFIVKDLISSCCDVNLQETIDFINISTLHIFLTAMNVRPATRPFNGYHEDISHMYDTYHNITLSHKFDESPFYKSDEFKTFKLNIKKIKNLDISYDKYSDSRMNNFKTIIIFNTSDNTIYDKLKFIKEKVIERNFKISEDCMREYMNEYHIMMGDILGYGYQGIPPRNKQNYSIGIKFINDLNPIGYYYFNFICPTEHLDMASDKVDKMVELIKVLFQKISLDYTVEKYIDKINDE